MMVVVLFQLIFLNKTKYSSCRDLSPNRPFQELLRLMANAIFNFHFFNLSLISPAFHSAKVLINFTVKRSVTSDSSCIFMASLVIPGVQF